MPRNLAVALCPSSAIAQVGGSSWHVAFFATLMLGPATTGSARMADVAIGAAVGLLFSQILPASEQSQSAKAD